MDFVNSCLSCQERKQPRVKISSGLKISSEDVNDLVAMDLQGPLNRTQYDHSYILVIQDVFTRYVALAPLRDSKAETVAHAFLSSWVGPFGVPCRLLTDNGTNFTSDLFDDVMIILKIKKVWTSPYHPQGNGTVERMNCTINNMLSHYVNKTHDNWDIYLPMIAFAHNATHN